MDPARSAAMFYHALSRLDYNNEARSPGNYAQRVQQSALPDRYDERFQDASDLYDRLEGNMPAPTPPVNRPDFNEYAKWSTNCEGRGGTTIDLWLIHTQEGDGNADSLADFLISTQGGPNPVSYHYTVSEDPNDHGVTVVDVVDTDKASWSVLDANDRSINLCFAGSRVAWTRDQWMQQSKAIEAAAYLCVQDCTKYRILKQVIPPPYNDDPPGITDHRYVTEHLGVGNHTDVGDNFPWDYFIDRVNFWANAQAPAPQAQPSPL
jgi:N-acetyl-anhydromuramyl-L-alanine amidase AmpD